jgi:hypothetical protein
MNSPYAFSSRNMPGGKTLPGLSVILIIVIGAAFGLSGCVAAPSVQETLPAPPSIPANFPPPPTLTLRPANCVPLPRPTQDPSTRTPTPDMSKPRTPAPYVPGPTITPLPFTRVVDLDPGFPMEDKHFVEVFGCDGTYSIWFLGMWRNTDVVPLQPGDLVLYDWPGSNPFPSLKNLPAPIASPYPTPQSPSLSYNHSPEALLIEATTYSSGQRQNAAECNFIPDLRVWGDGRIVYAPAMGVGGRRQVQVAKLDENTTGQVITLFDRHNFFAPWVWAPMPSTGGGGFDLQVHLDAGNYGSGAVYVLYHQMLTLMGVDKLPVYVPQKALLKIGTNSPRGFPGRPGQPLEWPAQLGLLPSDVGPDGRWIEGPGLAGLWDQINISFGSDPVWTDAVGNAYKVWLEIPGVTQPISAEQCVPAQVTYYPPGYKPTATIPPSYPVPFLPQATHTLWPGYPAPHPTITIGTMIPSTPRSYP